MNTKNYIRSLFNHLLPHESTAIHADCSYSSSYNRMNWVKYIYSSLVLDTSGFHSNHTYHGDLIHKGHQLHAEGYQQGPGWHLAQAPAPTRLVSSQQCGRTPAVAGKRTKKPTNLMCIGKRVQRASSSCLCMKYIFSQLVAEVSVNGSVGENWQKCVGWKKINTESLNQCTRGHFILRYT